MAETQNNTIVVNNDKKIKDLKSREYGEIKDQKLVLSLIEGLYLLNKNKIKINKPKKELLEYSSSKINNFELKYLVYSDLRERGLFLANGGKNADFYLYSRGDKPSSDSFSTLIYVLSERKLIEMKDLVEKTQKSRRIRKKSILALIDGEGDITYYKLKKFKPSGKEKNNHDLQAKAKILDDRIIAWDGGKDLYLTNFYGKPFLENTYQLTFFEAHYLSSKNIIDLKTKEIEEKGKKLDSKFELKNKVYRDLRKKGLVPKTGFKFGAHFRVYKSFDGPKELGHAKYLVQALSKKEKLNPPTLSRAVRLAQNVRKKMLFAVIDRDIEYLEIERVKI